MDKNVKVSPLAAENENTNWLDRRISSSALKEAKKSTRDFIWYYKKPREVKKHFDFGNAIELYLLDRKAFNKEVAILDEEPFFEEVRTGKPDVSNIRATTVYKKLKSEWDSQNIGKYVINKTGSDSLEIIEKIAEMCLDHPDFPLLFGGDYQKPYEWICPKTGLKRYARTDVSNTKDGIIIDMKTDAKGEFERACVNNDYWMQAFDQMIGAVESGAMKEVKEYYWFVITKEAPYFIDIYRIPLDQILRVEESYWSTLNRLKTDLSGDPEKIVWHQSPIQTIKVPNYYK